MNWTKVKPDFCEGCSMSKKITLNKGQDEVYICKGNNLDGCCRVAIFDAINELNAHVESGDFKID